MEATASTNAVSAWPARSSFSSSTAKVEKVLRLPKKHWGTFLVNVVACFALGLVLALSETCASSSGIALLMGVGFFGSLSTFSTFAVELLNELRAGQTLTAVVLALASIGAGLLAAAVGYGLGTHA